MFLSFDTQCVKIFGKNHDEPWFGFKFLIDTHSTPNLT
jgi:hypothetical protein